MHSQHIEKGQVLIPTGTLEWIKFQINVKIQSRIKTHFLQASIVLAITVVDVQGPYHQT